MAAGVETLEEPETFLGEGERLLGFRLTIGPRDQGRWRRPGVQGGEGGGQASHTRMLEDEAHGHLTAEQVAEAARGLDGEQRMAAEVEEAVVEARQAPH